MFETELIYYGLKLLQYSYFCAVIKKIRLLHITSYSTQSITTKFRNPFQWLDQHSTELSFVSHPSVHAQYVTQYVRVYWC